MRCKNHLIVLLASCASLSVCPLGAQQNRPLQYREVFRVGGLGDETVFTEVTAVVGRGDNLIVLDRRESRLVEIDQSGRFVRETGQPGEGPGDFDSPTVAGVLDDANFWVVDYGLDRITFFDHAWQVVRTDSRWPTDVTPRAVLTDSTAVGTVTVDGARSLVILDLPGFSRGLTIDELDWNHRDLIFEHPDGPQSGKFFMREPFGDWDLFGTFPNGVIWAVQRGAPAAGDSMATVTVSRWDREGKDLAKSSISLEKRAIPPEVLEEALTDVAETGYPRIYPKPVFTLDQVREMIYLPDYLPPIDDVVSSASGELILKEAGPGNSWLRFSPPVGLVTGHIEFPEGFEPMVVSGNRVAGRQIDEFGVHMLVALEVSWN